MVNIDLTKIRNILTLRYDPRGETVLPKLTWKDFVEYPNLNVKHVQTLLEGTIKKIIEKAKPQVVGMGVSGGVDSTTVLALTRKLYPDLTIHTYCVTFGSAREESKDAVEMAKIYATEHRDVHVENPFKDLKEQVTIIDEPRWNLYPYYLFKEVKEECDLLLTGDGGDELFGGYVFRYSYMLNHVDEPVVSRYLSAHNRDWVPDQHKLFAFPFYWQHILDLLKPHFENPLKLLGKVFLADYNGKLLYDFAPVMKKYSKHFRLPYYAPMLEPEVLHVATHVPYKLKYDQHNNVGKLILKQILLENFGFKPVVKGKIGWGMDLVEMWYRYVRRICEKEFDDPLFVKEGLINKEWLSVGFERSDEHNVRYINKMLGLLALEYWLQNKQENGPQKKGKGKRGRPIGGRYPESIRAVWREYKRAQREAQKESQKFEQ